MVFTDEELQELAYNGNYLNRQVSQDYLVRNLASELLDERLSDDEWINLKDGLPEYFGEFIICIDNKWVKGVLWDDEYRRFMTESYPITHWMHLPNPPERSEE